MGFCVLAFQQKWFLGVAWNRYCQAFASAIYRASGGKSLTRYRQFGLSRSGGVEVSTFPQVPERRLPVYLPETTHIGLCDKVAVVLRDKVAVKDRDKVAVEKRLIPQELCKSMATSVGRAE